MFVDMNLKRVEAIREMNVAEVLMLSEDYIGARDKLVRAKQLFPQLDDDIDPMLTLCNIFISANNLKLSSMVDHYWVLELMPSSTSSDIASRYHKLVHLLQAIKNKFSATDLALELVESAYNVLSDQEKRHEFDSRRKENWELKNIAACYDFDQEDDTASVQETSKEEGFCAVVQEFYNFDQEDGTASVQETSKEEGFCAVVQEFYNFDQEDGTVSVQETSKEDGFCAVVQEFYNFEQNRKVEVFEAGQVWAVHYHHHYQRDVIHNFRYASILVSCGNELTVAWLKPAPLTESERQWHDANLPFSCGSFDLDSDMIEDVSPEIFSYKCCDMVGDYEFKKYPRKGEIWAVYKTWNLDEWLHSPETMSDCRSDLVEMVTEFSQFSGGSCVHLVKMDGFRSVFKRATDGNIHIPPQNWYIFSHNIPAHRLMGGDIDKVVNGVFELDQLSLPDEFVHYSNTRYAGKEIPNRNWLAEGQIWTIYCVENNMPQQYTRIDRAISETEVSVTFLEPEAVLGYEVEWMQENLPVTCGMFRLSKTSVVLEMSRFSHLVEAQQLQAESEELCYVIYPKKGEVWAMYKNWNGKWKHCDYKSHQCCVVEILSEFSDGNGIKIASLGEVEDCLTFFQRQQQNGFELVRVVPQSEMLSFSHRIPAFRVPGIGSYGIPEESWHLEPSALPPMHSIQMKSER